MCVLYRDIDFVSFYDFSFEFLELFRLYGFFFFISLQFAIHMYCFIVCEDKVADIIFVADLSSSIGYGAFDQLRSFIKNVVERFAIGPGNIQIGLITYSNVAKTEFDLKKYR